ncbi:hypothetical protein BK134_26955 [Paenibacillus peoriae]|nr:hypothetical protein BK134_26955 [Paenibacillus peoriae]
MSRSLSLERRALLLRYLEKQPGHAPGEDFLMYEWLAAERALLQTGELTGPTAHPYPSVWPACPPISEAMGQVFPFPQRYDKQATHT